MLSEKFKHSSKSIDKHNRTHIAIYLKQRFIRLAITCRKQLTPWLIELITLIAGLTKPAQLTTKQSSYARYEYTVKAGRSAEDGVIHGCEHASKQIGILPYVKHYSLNSYSSSTCLIRVNIKI